MTKEEIINNRLPADVLAGYGIKVNRAGFAPCVFHQEKTASMKVYKDGFHCFGCGAHGDVIDLVMQLEQVSFKDAFLILGGTYENKGFSGQLAVYRAEKAKMQREKEALRAKRRRRAITEKINAYQSWIPRLEPLSDAWCDCMNALQMELYHYEKEIAT